MTQYQLKSVHKETGAAKTLEVEAGSERQAMVIASEQGYAVSEVVVVPKPAGDSADHVGREYRSSRWAALFTLSLAAFVRPWIIRLEQNDFETKKSKSLLFPWIIEHERMSYRSVASVRHSAGLIWDMVIVETRGGANALNLNGMRKREAKRLTEMLRSAVDRVEA